MAKSSVMIEIEEKLRCGVSKEKLNKQYHKGTVTKVFNKIKNEIHEENDDVKELEGLLKKAIKLIDTNREYEIRILAKEIKSSEMKSKSEVLNPFEIYDSLNKDGMVKKLNERKIEELKNVIRKYFNYDSKILDKYTKEQLCEYIYDKVEKTLNIGVCFK